MKQVKINAYQIGLVFKNDAYQRLLKEGKYWFWEKVQVYIYDLTKPFVPLIELNILLQDKELAEMLHVVEVKDNEIVLLYENGLLKQVLTAGRYTFWKSAVQYEFVRADISKIEITENIDRTVLQNRAVQPFVRSYDVQNHEKALLFVDGKFVQTLNSGAYYWWKNSISINVGKVDTRQQQLEVNGQEILTKDKAALRINAWAQYKVVDVEKALLQNGEYQSVVYLKGVDENYRYVSGVADHLIDGEYDLGNEEIPKLILGAGVEGAKAAGAAGAVLAMPAAAEAALPTAALILAALVWAAEAGVDRRSWGSRSAGTARCR